MSFSEYAKIHHVSLAKHITSFLESKKDKNATQLHNQTLHKLIAFVPSGKLLRGIAVLLAYEMNGGKDITHSLHAAAAIELAHSSLLIHDDIMDNDYVRRGKDTIFNQFAKEAQGNTKNPMFYGQSMGIVAGDIGFFLAFQLLNKTRKPDLMRIFAHELQLVGPAQMYDFHYGQTSEEPTYEEIMTVYRYKTGRYTFSLPLMLGAKMAQADDKILTTLEILGEKLGIVFQIHDDYLGIFGTEEKTGKPVGSDIRENKKTLLRQMLFTCVNESEQKKLQTIFGNENCTHTDIAYVQKLLETYEVLHKIEILEKTYIQEVEALIQVLPVQEKYEQILQGLVRFTVERQL